MRVSQIQNLTWAGNVLVLAGLAWVGLQFWNVRKQKPPAETTWPKAKTVDAGVRWPGDLATFDAIWKTPIGGKNPPPVEPPKPPPPVDRWTQFQGDLKYLGGWVYLGAPERSMVRLNYKGKDFLVVPGQMLGASEFQLLGFTIDESKKDAEQHTIKTAVLVFRHPDTGANVTWTQVVAPGMSLPPGVEPFRPSWPGGGAFDPERVSERGPLERTAYLDPTTGDWMISEDEMVWMDRYGEKDLWSKLVLKPDVDKNGVSHGLRIVTQPEQGTALAHTHGLNPDDVVRSINGVPMTSKEDVANYLRGDGKGLSVYRVVVDSAGNERTVVFRIIGRRT